MYIFKKGNIIGYDQKVGEMKIRMMIHVRVHVMVAGVCNHMTNFLKWSKPKVVALNCSFQNLFESCSKVLLLWIYEVKDFEKCHFFFLFFFFCFLHFSP